VIILSRAPYDQIAAEFAKLRNSLWPKEKEYLDLVVEHLKPRDEILDLGCGSGTPIAVYLDKLGFSIYGVDASKELLAIAKKSLPKRHWKLGDMEKLELNREYAAVICWDSLFHLPRAEHPKILRNIHCWLQPGGRLMLSSGGIVEDELGFTDKMFNHEFYYDSLPIEQLTKTLEEIGFEIVLSEMIDLPDGAQNKGKRATIAQKLNK